MPKNKLDDTAFYRFDSKLFYIIRRNGAGGLNAAGTGAQAGAAGNALVNGGLSQRVIPYTNEQRFQLPEGLLIRDCILKKPIKQREMPKSSASRPEKGQKQSQGQGKNSQKMLDQNTCLSKAGVRNVSDVCGHNDGGKQCSTQESARNSKKGTYKGSLRSQRPSVAVEIDESHHNLMDKCYEKALNSTGNT